MTSAMSSSRAITRRRRSGGTGRRPDTNVATFPSGSMMVISSKVAESVSMVRISTSTKS